jgi:hypothetical protein
MVEADILDKYVDNWAWMHPDQFERLLKQFNSNDDVEPEPLKEDAAGSLALGEVAVNDFANTRVLDRLVMYERRIENSLYKTHAQFQHLQLRRKKSEEASQKPED